MGRCCSRCLTHSSCIEFGGRSCCLHCADGETECREVRAVTLCQRMSKWQTQDSNPGRPDSQIPCSLPLSSAQPASAMASSRWFLLGRFSRWKTSPLSPKSSARVQQWHGGTGDVDSSDAVQGEVDQKTHHSNPETSFLSHSQHCAWGRAGQCGSLVLGLQSPHYTWGSATPGPRDLWLCSLACEMGLQ